MGTQSPLLMVQKSVWICPVWEQKQGTLVTIVDINMEISIIFLSEKEMANRLIIQELIKRKWHRPRLTSYKPETLKREKARHGKYLFLVSKYRQEMRAICGTEPGDFHLQHKRFSKYPVAPGSHQSWPLQHAWHVSAAYDRDLGPCHWPCSTAGMEFVLHQ